MSLLPLLLSASLAWGQGGNVSVSNFKGGLNTSESSLNIAENESPNLSNVILDKTNGLTRRQGHRKLNTTALGSGAEDVNAVYQLNRSNGTQYCIAFSTASGAYSTDSCATFTVFVSTLVPNTDVNCDASEDALFCVNGSYNFKFDGTNDIAVAGMPSGLKYLKVHRNYCFGAGGATPSRLYYSDAGDCDTWPSTAYVDVAPNDGDVITGIGEPLYDLLPIYKKFSTWVIKGASPDNFQLINISKNTGAVNHRTIKNLGVIQMFDSVGPNGGQPGIYGFDGIQVREMSRKLRNTIDNLDTYGALSGRYIIDTKADWDAGTFDSGAMSSSRDAGFMQSSYTALTDDTNSDFSLGTFVQTSTDVIFGKVTLDYATDFSTYSALDIATPTTPSLIAGCPLVKPQNWIGLTFTGFETTGYCGQKSFSNSLSTGSWLIGVDMSGQETGLTPPNITEAAFKFISDGTDFLYSKGYSVSVYKVGANNTAFRLMKHGQTGRSVLCSSFVNALPSVRYLRVSRTRTGAMTLERNTSATPPFTPVCSTVDASNFGTTNAILFVSFEQASSFLGSVTFSAPLEPGLYSTGTFVSRAFDTYISTPVWGLFEATISSNSASRVTFETQVATSTTGTFDSLVAATLDKEVASAQKRAIKYKGTFATAVTSQTASIDVVEMAAASTGTWRSGELVLSSTMTTWGLFQCAQTVSGTEASLAYAIRTSTYVGGTAYATYQAITCGSLITASTGAYIQVISTATVGVATETARIDALIFGYNQGTSARSASAAVFGGRYHYGAQSKNGTKNDILFVYDSNGAWTKWDGLRPRFLNVVNQNFVMADSTRTTGGFIHKLYETDADDGGAINAYWESKDFSMGSLENAKAPERLYLVYTGSQTTITATIKMDGGQSTFAYDVDLSTAANVGVKNIVVDPPINGNLMRLRLENNAASKPWEFLGFGIRFRDVGLIQP